MAKKITDEQKEMINELFLEYGVKKKVAEIMGISPTSVARYIVPNYVSKKERKTYTFNGYVGNSEWLIDIFKTFKDPAKSLCSLCVLGKSEIDELEEMKKEIYL